MGYPACLGWIANNSFSATDSIFVHMWLRWVAEAFIAPHMQCALVTQHSIEAWHKLRLGSSLVTMSSETDRRR